jgi:hypothetical protein
MMNYRKKLVLAATLAVSAVACSGSEGNPTRMAVVDGTETQRSSLGGIGSIAMPKSFAGGRVSVAMADAWAECPHSAERTLVERAVVETSVDAPLTAIRKDMRAAIAACQGTGGLQVTGDLFKDWVALRGTLACNVDASAGTPASVPLDARWTTTSYTPTLENTASPSLPYTAGLKFEAAREVTYGATNLCMAQKLNERFQGEDLLLLDASDQRVALEHVRERSQLAMLQLSALWQALALPDVRFDVLPPGRAKAKAPIVDTLQAWAYCTPNLARTTGQLCSSIGSSALSRAQYADLPAAVALHTQATRQLIDLLVREASARTNQNDRAKSVAERDFGPGSWRQRAAALLWGGDPLSADEGAAWRTVGESTRLRGPTGATFTLPGTFVEVPLWPSAEQVPFVTTSMADPRVEVLRSKLSAAGGTVPAPTVAANGAVDVAAFAANLYWRAEAYERWVRCGGTCGTLDAVVASVDRAAPMNAVLRSGLGVDLSHAQALAQALVQALPKRDAQGAVVAPGAMLLVAPGATDASSVPLNFSARPRPAWSFASRFAELPLAFGPTGVRTSQFAPTLLERTASCFTHVSATASDVSPTDPRVDCATLPGNVVRVDERDTAVADFGFQYASTSNNEAARTMGAMPALAATRASMQRTLELFAAASGPRTRPSLASSLSGSFAKATEVIDAAVGPVALSVRPETFLSWRIANGNIYAPSYVTTTEQVVENGAALWRAEVGGVPALSAGDQIFLDVYPYAVTTVDALLAGGSKTAVGVATANGVVPNVTLVASAVGTYDGSRGVATFRKFSLGQGTSERALTFAIRIVRANGTSTTSLREARRLMTPEVTATEGAPIVGLCFNGCPANQSLRYLLGNRGFDDVTGGAFGERIERVWGRDSRDWSRPSVDAFDNPTDWVPPLDPQLVGTAASSNSAQYYLARATAAADVAREATNTAFQTLLQSANDAQAKEIQARRSKEVEALEQKNLCGAEPNCDVQTVGYRLDLGPEPACNPANIQAAVDEVDKKAEQLACTLNAAWKASTVELVVLAEVSETLRNGVATRRFEGGKLQSVVARQVAAVTRLKAAYDETKQAVELAKASLETARATLKEAEARRDQSWWNKCTEWVSNVAVTAVAIVAAVAAAPVTGGASVAALVAYAAAKREAFKATAQFLAAVAMEVVQSSDGESAYWRTVRANHGVAVASAYERILAAQSAVGASVGRLSVAFADYASVVAEADRAQAESKLVVARQNLEAELAVAGLQTSVGLYRRYHTYDVWRARAALENARREALTARRAIEARYVVDLSRMDAAEPYVAAPSSWADEIYDYDLSMPAAVGLSIGTPIPGGVYPYKIGDYVANLSSFVNGYPVSRPTAVNRREDDVITLEGPDQRVAGSTTVRTPAAAALWIARCEGTGPTAGSTLVCAGASTSGWCSIPDARSAAAACDALTGTTTRTVNVAPKALRARFQMDAWGRRAGTATDTPNRHNVRWSRFAVNLVGTGVRDCTRATDRTACFADGTVRYTLRQASRPWVSDYLGQWRVLGLGEGSTSSSRALANEQWLDVLTNGWDKPFVGAVARDELFERPVGGLYDLDLEVPAEVRPERIERVQILTQQTSWVAQTPR